MCQWWKAYMALAGHPMCHVLAQPARQNRRRSSQLLPPANEEFLPLPGRWESFVLSPHSKLVAV